MALPPIVERELRVTARRRGTYWMRSIAALVAIILGCFIFAACHDSPPREFGTGFFFMLSAVSLGYCLLAGLFLTADSISAEKREGTLGLLFLTDLKGYDVVFGKLAATSINGFSFVVAIIPMLAIPLLVGGTSIGQFWRFVLVLVNTFLFSLAVGIFISSVSQHPRKAMGGTFLLLLLFTAGFPVLALSSHFLLGLPDRFALPLLSPCAISSMVLANDGEYSRSWRYFWMSVGVIHGLTWLFLVLASVITPRSWQDKPGGAIAGRLRALLLRMKYGGAAERKSLRTRLLDVNAFYWLAGRAWLRPARAWFWLGLAGGLWYCASKACGAEWFNDLTFILTAFILNAMLKWWIASEAGRQLAEDRKLGALELVLSTPLSVREILRGQWLALRRQFLRPFLTVIAVELIFMIASLRPEPGHGNRRFLATAWCGIIFLLVLDWLALGWVAMWTALTTKSPNRVTAITVSRILVAPMVLFVIILVCVAITDDILRTPGSRPAFDPTWKFFVGLWLGLGILVDVAFGLPARWLVCTRFRELALPRFGRESSRLSRWFKGRVPENV